MGNRFEVVNTKKLEGLLGYKFSNVLLLQEALSHPSLKQETLDKKVTPKDKITAVSNYVDYERLEFLGDAILDFIITEMLFKKFSDHSEGGLAKIKSFLVSKEILNKISAKLSLAEFIIMTRGEETSGGRQNPSNIENVMEALIAAIYLDSDIANTKSITENLWQDYLDDFDYDSVDPKTSLQEWSQKHKAQIPKYELASRSGPDHSPVFTIKCLIDDLSSEASATSIKSAEKLAAKKLLDSIKNR